MKDFQRPRYVISLLRYSGMRTYHLIWFYQVANLYFTDYHQPSLIIACKAQSILGYIPIVILIKHRYDVNSVILYAYKVY